MHSSGYIKISFMTTRYRHFEKKNLIAWCHKEIMTKKRDQSRKAIMAQYDEEIECFVREECVCGKRERAPFREVYTALRIHLQGGGIWFDYQTLRNECQFQERIWQRLINYLPHVYVIPSRLLYYSGFIQISRESQNYAQTWLDGEVIGIRLRTIADDEKDSQQSSLESRLDSLEQMMGRVYYSPGMPGYVESKNNFDSLSATRSNTATEKT